MVLRNLWVIRKAKLSVAVRLFPLKTPEMVIFDRLELQLAKVKVETISFPCLVEPCTTGNICPVFPELERLEAQLDQEPQIEDLTQWLLEQLIIPPIIEEIPVSIGKPRCSGKRYKVKEEPESQISQQAWEDEDCIHLLGGKKGWCQICRNLQKEKTARIVSLEADPFDLIFPLLQPPLQDLLNTPIPFPPQYSLYPFQRSGVKFLIENESALLADEMGLGKSIQAIIAMRCLFTKGIVSTCLILCPGSVLSDWEKKLWEWAPDLRVLKVRGTKEEREAFWRSPSNVYLTTYDSFRQDLSQSLISQLSGDSKASIRAGEFLEPRGIGDIARKQFDLVVLDEIQKTKNPRTDITKAVRLIESPRRWGLSGTPLENRLDDVISIFAFLRPGLLTQSDRDRPSKVKAEIKPYILRRKKDDALPELPKKFYSERRLELTPEQLETYKKAEDEGIIYLSNLGESVSVQHILQLVQKLKQICNIDPVSGKSCKLDYLLEKLEELEERDEKALIFSQYPEKTLRILQEPLEKFRPLLYAGNLTDKERDERVERFQKQNENKVLLMSVKAGSLGITLTRAN